MPLILTGVVGASPSAQPDSQVNRYAAVAINNILFNTFILYMVGSGLKLRQVEDPAEVIGQDHAHLVNGEAGGLHSSNEGLEVTA